MYMAKEIGKVVHYYGKAGAAVIKLTAPLKTGDTITFQRGDEQFVQPVVSIQSEHESVEQAKKGAAIGLKVDQKVRPGTVVLQGDASA